MSGSGDEDLFACDWSMQPQSRDTSPLPALSRSTTTVSASHFGGALYSDFSGGDQVFSFLNGRWRLTDFEWKCRCWAEALEKEDLANLVVQVALDLADSRRGGLFAILDDAASVSSLVSPGDLLVRDELNAPVAQGADSKRSVSYLLSGKRTTDLRPAVLRTLAAIDGGIVLDREGKL